MNGSQLTPGEGQRGLVSVVVPCYNYGRYLPGCVSSALNLQGDTDVEVVIVDDCSTDNSAAIAAQLAANESRIRVVTHASNQGHIRTYNDGLEASRGQFIALVSADDQLTPGALPRALAVFAADPSTSFVYGPVAHTDDPSPDLDASKYAALNEEFDFRIHGGRDWALRVADKARNPIASPEVVVRASAQREVGGYKTDLPHSGDLEMWLRLATAGSVGQVRGPFQAVRRIHSRNMSSTYVSVDDMLHVELAFETFARRAARIWPDAEDRLPHVRRVLARRAVRSALDDTESSRKLPDDIHDVVRFARDRNRLAAISPSNVMLRALVDGQSWAKDILPLRSAVMQWSRRRLSQIHRLRDGLPAAANPEADRHRGQARVPATKAL